MRTKLKNRDGERTVFRDIFVRYGKKRGWCKIRAMPHSDSGVSRTPIPGHAAQ